MKPSILILYRYLLFLLINGLLFINTAMSQDDGQMPIPSILLPTPNAAELGKYGEIPINMSTGALNLSIPLFEYTTRNISLPLSLSYSTNGFRVNAISSRAGFDWVLNCGGTITRTIVKEPDLDHDTYRWPRPSNMNVLTDSLYDFLYNSSSGSAYDCQPDIFYYNFNNYSGKFVVDDQGKILTIPHNNLKVEYLFKPDSTSFKVTTPDGMQYYFGGNTATEFSRVVESSVCGGAEFADYEATGWNLTKIKHPNGDSVLISYETGNANYYSSVRQTCYTRNFTGMHCNGDNTYCPVLPNQLCYTRMQTLYSRPTLIRSSAFGSVEFTYQTRNDMTGDGMISSVTLFNDQHIQIRKFLFEYQQTQATGPAAYGELKYRDFLTGLQEFGKTGSSPKNHRFSYKNLMNLPPRLSFSQDYLGYYNGASNSWLVPKPVSADDQAAFGNVGGDRNPKAAFVDFGLLSKVVYPTGGASAITYENHQKTYKSIIGRNPGNERHIGGRGDNALFDYGENTIYTDTFTAVYTSVGQINTAFVHDDGFTDPDNHIRMRAEILNETTGQVRYSKLVFQNQSLHDDTIHLTQGVKYRLRISMFATYQYSGGLRVAYYGPTLYDTVDVTLLSPGARVKQVVAMDSVNDLQPQITAYRYAWLPNFSASNVEFPGTPVFTIPYTLRMRCISFSGGGMGGTPIPSVSNQLDCNYRVLYSNAQNAESLVPASTMYYSVLQSFGPNFENGGKEYKFLIESGNGSFPVMGVDQIQAPHSNTGYQNGDLDEENTFKMINNQPVYLKKIKHIYNTDPRNSAQVKGFFITKSYDPTIGSTIPHSAFEFEAFNVNSYLLGAPWRYISKTTTTDFNQDGNQALVRVDSMMYDNPLHAIATRTTSTTSTGQLSHSKLYYPQDTVLTGAAEVARQQLISTYAIGSLISSKSELAQSVEVRYNEFKKMSNNKVVMNRIMANTGPGYAMETAVNFTDYNDAASLQSAVARNGLIKNYLYGYKSQYPVAEITGIPFSSITPHINQSILDNPTSDSQLRTYLNNLRSLFPKAMIKTFTYQPLVGMTSETDVNGRTIYYEYDSFNRLTLVRDNENNILKRICYNYYGQPDNCGTTNP